MNNMAWIADDGHCVGFIIRRGKTVYQRREIARRISNTTRRGKGGFSERGFA